MLELLNIGTSGYNKPVAATDKETSVFKKFIVDTSEDNVEDAEQAQL